jgi:hypothetical protein
MPMPRGYVWSQEQREKLSKAHKGKHAYLRKFKGMLGKHHSEETKIRIAEKLKSAGIKPPKSPQPFLPGVLNPQFGKRGHLSPAWKGGKFKDSKGYVLVYSPEHPNREKNGYVYEHRLEMEKSLGCLLRTEERVHHKNKIVDDNNPENLKVFPSNCDHLNFHKKET